LYGRGTPVRRARRVNLSAASVFLPHYFGEPRRALEREISRMSTLHARVLEDLFPKTTRAARQQLSKLDSAPRRATLTIHRAPRRAKLTIHRAPRRAKVTICTSHQSGVGKLSMSSLKLRNVFGNPTEAGARWSFLRLWCEMDGGSVSKRNRIPALTE